MRSRLVAFLVSFAALGGSASAGLAPAALDTVFVEPAPGAALPLDVTLQTEMGSETVGHILAAHPAWLLVFADYTCTSVCGPAIGMAGASFAAPELRNLDAGLLVVGLDPKDGRADADRMRADTLPAPGNRRAVFAVADAEAIRRLTEAVGYHDRYDPETDQFAHPAAGLALSARGEVTRALGSLSLSPTTLRTAMVEAGDGHVGGLMERIALRCYGFDPVRGLYTADIMVLLRALGALTLLALALLLVRLHSGSPHKGDA